MVAVFAINVRKGNVIEKDGKLYVVIKAENIHPGKGTPVTQLEMRRISDGVKVNERFKTTDQLERAFIDSRPHSFLYQDGDHYVFMDPKSFEQVTVSKDVMGDGALYLAENMEVSVSLYNGVAIAVELPPRAVVEVAETEPAFRGQTASGSFKPALLVNGVRTMVPTHITPGARIVVSTADGSYLERAKD